MEHADLAGELLVDPLAGLRLREVVEVLASAEVPRLHVVGDVHGLADLVTIHIVEETDAPSAWWELLKLLLAVLGSATDSPWGVVSCSHRFVVVSLRSALSTGVEVRECSRCLLFPVLGKLRVWARAPAHTEDVVYVDFLDDRFKLGKQVHAFIGDSNHRRHMPVAIQLLELLMHILAHQGVPIGHIKLRRRAIELPVGDSIADGEPLQVRLEGIPALLLVVLDDVVGQVRNIDASIGLSRDVQVVVLELRELLEPAEHDFQVVLSASMVIERAILLTFAVGVADASGLLNVEHVGLAIPTVVGRMELGAT